MKNVWEVELLKREEISASLDGKIPYILPIASSEVLGGVQPIQKTEEMNQQVGVDEKGRLWFAKPDVEGFVSFQENQELSDSQKVQARDNINAEGYDWHGLRSPLTNNNIVGFAANSEVDGAAVINWPIALNIKSTKSDDYIALYVLLSQVDLITNGSYIDQQLSIIENTIIPEAEALINSGCMSIENGEALWRMYYCIQLGILQKIKKLSIQKKSQGVWYFTGSNGSVMYYNGKLYNNTVKPSYDKTLTIKGTAADAKAVGDALATKLDRSELPNSIVQSVNGIAPDQSGNVEVNALPDNTEQLEMLIEADLLPAVHDASGAILTDENGNIILRY